MDMEKMATDSHRRGSERSHSGKEKDSKANGIWKQMNDEEYEREKAEIRDHLSVLMYMVKKSVEDQRCGYMIRNKVRC